LEAPEGWVRLHPLSPLLDAGRLLALGLFLAVRSVLDWVSEGGSIRPGLRLVAVVGAALIVGGTLVFGYASIAYRFRCYRVTETLVEMKSGIFFRTHRQLPFDRVESVDTAQPLIPRLLGLAAVRAHAVSSGAEDVHLRYLTLADAVRLREVLAARRSAGGAPIEDLTAPAAILQVPQRELVLGYFVLPLARSAALLAVALLLAAIFGGVEAVLLVAFLGLIGALPSLVTKVIQVERLWEFRLDDGPDALVIRRGLLNVNTQRIHTGRVQAIRVDQPLVWRLLDRYRLVVDVAGHRGTKVEETGVGVLLPIAPPEVVRWLLQRLEVRADIGTLPYAAAPARARWRSLRHRTLRMARTQAHLIVRAGVLWRKTTIVAHARVQSARVTQGPWQRVLGLASLHLDTAGPRVRVVALHRSVPEAVGQAQESARIAAATVTADA
jgi:putative membrane protein